ncbi:hypothetical protein [Desulfitobacterium sp.]|uniref:hypothetical protein n=1 Tax=Desulfitobacterium sp. TaxID=49981 RepID=UPI002B20B285|nr:hypothetical protein [Desulfitobacterium sp.]MEA4902295.1 hypothetical protein [Desulfitobacterium sp.]
MSALHDYLKGCLADRTKADLLLEGQPPQFIEGEIRSFNDEYLWIEPDKQISMEKIIAFPDSAI